MSSSLLWITFVGETEGERKRIFTTIETDNLGEVKHLEQIKKDIYRILLLTSADVYDLHTILHQAGNFPINIKEEDGHTVWSHRRYNEFFPNRAAE